MKRLLALFALLAAVFVAPVVAQDAGSQDIPPELQAFLDELNPVSGKVDLPAAQATLDLGEDYIFYDATDAEKILVQLWGNPPQAATGILGMVMPAGSSPISDSWGAVVTFEETGYISDDDAAETDYDELLEAMQEGTRTNNAARTAAGYASIDLVGWADRPRYDRSTHSVVWAQNLAFADQEVHTLNYDVRTLGRYGVLSLNLISTMPELDNIRVAANDFAAHASFNEGARYADFDPSVDSAAEYGIAGLIAGGAGVAVAKKTGLIALLLKFIKPILIGLGIAAVAVWRFISGRRKDEYEEEWTEYYEEESGDVETDAPSEPEPETDTSPRKDPVE